jgi:AcrR family transcriptional regulator
LDTATVVQAAAEIADADGLDAVTLSSVASKLGVKPPSLYSHVEGLPDLKRRLAALSAADLADALTPAVAGRSRGDALRAAGRAYRDWALAHPGRHAAIQFVLIPDDPAAQRAVGLMSAVMAGYGLEGDAAIHAVRAMRAAIFGFVTLESGGGFGIPLAVGESFEWMLDLLDGGLSRTQRPEGE